MKINSEKLEPFAAGNEKIIYEHPHDPERLVAELKHWEIPADEMKGRYYLSKILHLLFPETIPDTSFAAGGDGRTSRLVMERKHLDAQHEKLRHLLSAVHVKQDAGVMDSALNDEVEQEEAVLRQQLNADPHYKDFIEKMLRIGVPIDDAAYNFGYDEKGHLLYVDNGFYPWSRNEYVFLPQYNEELLNAIGSLGDRDREQAMRYYERLEALRQEAEAKEKK